MQFALVGNPLLETNLASSWKDYYSTMVGSTLHMSILNLYLSHQLYHMFQSMILWHVASFPFSVKVAIVLWYRVSCKMGKLIIACGNKKMLHMNIPLVHPTKVLWNSMYDCTRAVNLLSWFKLKLASKISF